MHFCVCCCRVHIRCDYKDFAFKVCPVAQIELHLKSMFSRIEQVFCCKILNYMTNLLSKRAWHLIRFAFNPSRRSVLPVTSFLGDYGPCCLQIIDKILPCSSGLIPHRFMIIETPRGEILHGAPVQEIDSYFEFLPFE